MFGLAGFERYLKVKSGPRSPANSTRPDRGPCNRANCHLHRTPSYHAPVLAIILVSYLMIVLDISIVITALPEMD